MILVDFGRQVGVEMAPKIDAKTYRKNDANSDAFWMRLGWVFRRTGHGRRGPGPPPITLFLKKAPTNTNAHDTNESHTPCATSALADTNMQYNTSFLYKNIIF